jgi:hypothetical protein
MFTRATSSRPPHPALNVRDDRDTPLFGRGGMATRNHIFRKNRSEIFSREDWTTQISLNRLANFDSAGARFFGPERAARDAVTGKI